MTISRELKLENYITEAADVNSSEKAHVSLSGSCRRADQQRFVKGQREAAATDAVNQANQILEW